MTLIQISLILLLVSGYLIVTYKGFAIKRGLPVGEVLSNESGLIRTLGSLSLVAAIVGCFFYFSWYVAIALIIGSFIASYIIFILLKKNSQYVCILGLFAGIIMTLVHFIS